MVTTYSALSLINATGHHVSGFQYEDVRLADSPGVKDGRDVRVWFRIGANLLMNTNHAKAIVSPEPHSTGPDFRKALDYLPRCLQVVLSLAIIVVGILAAIFMK